MQTFRSLHLQKQLGMVQEAVLQAPVLFLRHGQPSAVMMSADEFVRLKKAASETVPPEALQRRAVTKDQFYQDPLGYDTRDLYACALRMAEDVRSGRTQAAVRAEIERFNQCLGRGAA